MINLLNISPMSTAAELFSKNFDAEFFDRHGYFVFSSGAIPTFDAAAIAEEISACFQAKKMPPNKVEFLLPDGPLQLTKPHVYEYDMHAANAAKDAPTLSRFFLGDMRDVAKALQSSGAESLRTLLAEPLRDMTLKMQVNTGGAFPWHYDNPAPPNKRLLTLGVYLTAEGYEPATNGGEIVLMPFLQEAVRIAPAFNTVVLFRSDMMLHRVLPFHPSARCPMRRCFTVWLDGASTNTDDVVNLRAKHLTPDYIPVMMTTPIQRSLSRVVYDEEYREALLACFGPNSREATISIKIHEAHVKPLLSNPAVAAFVGILRSKKV